MVIPSADEREADNAAPELEESMDRTSLADETPTDREENIDGVAKDAVAAVSPERVTTPRSITFAGEGEGNAVPKEVHYVVLSPNLSIGPPPDKPQMEGRLPKRCRTPSPLTWMRWERKLCNIRRRPLSGSSARSTILYS